MRQALRDALNGDAETVDPPVRRGLLVLAVAQDDADDRIAEHHAATDARISEHAAAFDARIDRMESTVDSMRKAVYGTGTFIVVTVVGAAAAIINRL